MYKVIDHKGLFEGEGASHPLDTLLGYFLQWSFPVKTEENNFQKMIRSYFATFFFLPFWQILNFYFTESANFRC